MSIRSASPALAAALLFGASTPLAKTLTGSISPILLAGLLYLGSGVGSAGVLLARRLIGKSAETTQPGPAIPRREIPWLLGAILAGGVAGPALLMTGLTRTGAAPASLLLNVEGVFTALIAWIVFKENADRQIVLGMIAIVAGGALLSWQPDAASLSPSALLIVAACACWAIDNNLTRNVSSNDAVLIACLKGWWRAPATPVLHWPPAMHYPRRYRWSRRCWLALLGMASAWRCSWWRCGTLAPRARGRISQWRRYLVS